MKQKILPILVLVIIAAVLVGGYIYKTNMEKARMIEERRLVEERTSYAPNGVTGTNEITTVSGNVQDIMKLNKPMRCSIVYENEDGKYSGELYVSGNKFRINSQTEVSGKTLMSSAVSDGTYMYMWSPDISVTDGQAFKMKITDYFSSSSVATIDGMPDQSDTMKVDYDYKCTIWSEKSETFAVPSDIEFIDYSEMMETFKNMPTSLEDYDSVFSQYNN